MSRIETVTTPPTPGAARRMCVVYWPPQGYILGSLSGQTSGSFRPSGFSNAAVALNFAQTGAPPAGSGGQFYKGVLAQALTSNLTSGLVATPNLATLPLVMPFQNVRGSADFISTELDDFRIWSASAILAFDAIPGAIVGDIGLAVGSGTRFAVRAAATQFAGMEIGPRNTGQLGVVVRQADAGPITFDQATPDQPDLTEFNLYEIRLYSASPTVEAQAVFLINGRVQFSLPWGAGTVLPDQVFGAGGNLGFTPGIGNFEAFNGTTRMYVVPGSFVVKAAPNDASLL